MDVIHVWCAVGTWSLPVYYRLLGKGGKDGTI